MLEDDFAAGRPPLEDVGVQLVGDVEPYELMKLRLLNAGHQALAYPARLLGYRYVHDAAGDPALARFLLDYMLTEAVPTLRPVPGIDLPGYAHELLRRFANPEVGDTVARLCANTSDLIPKFLLPGGPGAVGRRPSDTAFGRGRRLLGALSRGIDELGNSLRDRRCAGTAVGCQRGASGRGPDRVPARQRRPVR